MRTFNGKLSNYVYDLDLSSKLTEDPSLRSTGPLKLNGGRGLESFRRGSSMIRFGKEKLCFVRETGGYDTLQVVPPLSENKERVQTHLFMVEVHTYSTWRIFDQAFWNQRSGKENGRQRMLHSFKHF